MDLLIASDLSKGKPVRRSMRCTTCHHRGIFQSVSETISFRATIAGQVQHVVTAQCRCPNDGCNALVFVVATGERAVLVSYPPERIDFEPDGIAPEVLAVFEEALTCHAQQCFAASAMMIRRTLEEICRDRGAEGRNLQKRIEALGDKAVLPTELLGGLDALRLLGNDAAHVESRDYEQVGQDEVEVAIDVTKEILKSTYQLDSIVGRLTALQRVRSEQAE